MSHGAGANVNGQSAMRPNIGRSETSRRIPEAAVRLGYGWIARQVHEAA